MEAITFVDGEWLEGNPPLLGARTHATWLSSIVFDGARAFEGVTPDLDMHCERVIRSALALGLKPTLTAGKIQDIALQAVAKFPDDAELYIRPMFWAEEGWVDPDPDSTRFAMTVYVSPLPAPTGISVCLSTRRRPAPDMATTDAKASCLYPNASRALREAAGRGFDNAVMRDPLDNIAELATANIFIAKEGIVHTPVPNGTFLNGVTRRRVISLFRENNIDVQEGTVTVADLEKADEMFSTGNQAKVQPIIRYEDRNLQAGPMFKQARELYWEFAHR